MRRGRNEECTTEVDAVRVADFAAKLKSGNNDIVSDRSRTDKRDARQATETGDAEVGYASLVVIACSTLLVIVLGVGVVSEGPQSCCLRVCRVRCCSCVQGKAVRMRK